MIKIILDTNFLLIPAQYHVDIFAEIERLFREKYEIFVLERSMLELEKVAAEGRQKEQLRVKLTKALLKTQNIKTLTIDQEGSVDDILVKMAKKGYIIATQDQGLKRRIMRGLLTLRQKKYLFLKE